MTHTLQKNRGAVRRFGRLMRFANWLQSLPARMVPPPFRLVQMGAAFWQSRALYVAARLDLAGALGDETVSATALAERVGADPDAVFRLLRMLAALGVFEETSPRHFRNNKVSAHLRPDHPQSVRAMILMHNSAVMSRPWYEELEQGVRTGEVPFRRSHGVDLYGYMNAHPDFDALFSAAMDSIESVIGDTFATDFDWGRFERIIDVGGSKGSKSLAILKHYPALRALVVDRPQVIEGGREHWQGRVPDERLARMEFAAGDLFGALPPARGEGDIYLLSAVLHGFDDEDCVRALKNLAGAIGYSRARIAVLEMVVPEHQADYAGTSFDMQMFMATRGRERTLTEWQTLAGRSGLVLEEVVGLRSLGNILVLRAGS